MRHRRDQPKFLRHAFSRALYNPERWGTFQWKDYRNKDKQKSNTMTLASGEFIRHFLVHTLPRSFPRIRHFGLLANRHRKAKLALCRQIIRGHIPELLLDTTGGHRTPLEKVNPPGPAPNSS